MLTQIDMQGNEHQNDLDMKGNAHQNKLDMKLNQSKEKNPANESYAHTLNIVKRTIS